MDLHQFFIHFLQENELVRANLINDRSFESIEALVEYKEAEVGGLDGWSPVTGMLSMTEVELISHLVDIESGDHLHYVAYDVASYPVLIDYQYILEAGDGAGVIHHDIIQGLHAILKESGILPGHPMYIHKDEPLDPEEVRQLDRIYGGPIYWLYDNLTWRTLRATLKRLNVEPDGHQKEDYLRHITSVVTHPKYLEGILLQLGFEEYTLIRENVEKGFNVYEASSRWETAKEVGLLVKVHADYYVMHEAVRQALAQVNFKTVEDRHRRSPKTTNRQRQGGDYNAYVMTLTVKDIDFPISREIIVPAGINFFELHLVIQKAMGWQRKHDAEFRTGDITIFETLNQMNEADPGHMQMAASFTQVDAVFDQFNPLEYVYGDSYRVAAALRETANIHRAIPAIRNYEGPAPIENIGGAARLPDVLEILADPKHPDYVPTYEKVRATNYRERYPITAINHQLEKLFAKSHPLTEFNMDGMEV
ncbi:plasmid pRiA4b ORF-3 family protein [Salinicoccus bachuensis]|uniref:Plasmid pRiA4b ORF-3 family protein n=1 Tax=Salinicoccus bachuensis TaxID=3136731 RepID=A0ABZ3CIW3_9STAP